MQEVNKAVGARVYEVRKKQKLTREQLAERADISTQFLADIEGGKKGMTVITLKKLCVALGVSADFLIFGAAQPVTDAAAPDQAVFLSSDSALLALPPEKRQKLVGVFRQIAALVQP